MYKKNMLRFARQQKKPWHETQTGIMDRELVAYVNTERDGFPLCGNLKAGRVFWLRLITLFERQETCTQLDKK